MPRSKRPRIEFAADERTLEFLKVEMQRTGASASEIVRRALLAAEKVYGATCFKPNQETR